MACKCRIHRIAIVSLIAVILLSLGSTPAAIAAAGDETTPGGISAIPTFECIGVTVNYSGDNNQNNRASLEYRQTGGSWKTAPEMYVDRAERQYRGSIFWLTANTQYEVRVTFSDVDGVGGSSVSTTVKTRNDNPAIGTNYYYVATNGNDNNPGTQAQPFRTIQKAANIVNPGDTVLIRQGTYSEKVILANSGNPNGWITFMPYNNENVVITGNNTLGMLIFSENINYIRFKGLNFRDSLHSAILLCDSHDAIIEDCNFYNAHTQYGTEDGHGFSNLFGSITLLSYSYATQPANYNLLVQNCTFDWNNGDEGVSAGVGLVRARYGIVVRNNVFTSNNYELWDGVSTWPEDESNAQQYLESCDFNGNTVYRATDDGLQIEGGNKNVRIWNNQIEDCDIGIATCPVLEGPVYVFRNTVWNNSGRTNTRATKIGKQETGYGRLYYYHNTFYYTGENNGITQTNSGVGNIVSQNNIIYSGRYAIEITTNPAVPCDFDYDYLYSTQQSPDSYPRRFVKWGSSGGFSLEQFQDNTGQELHGISVANAGFTDVINGNFQLRPDSPCIDQGVIIPGFNDVNSPWPYSSNGPDIGAYEYAGGPAVDNTPPYTTGHSPAKGSSGVPPDTNISVNIRDSGTGVDMSSIVMRVEGSVVTPVISGSVYNYTVTYNPPTNFDYDQVVNVTVDARDLKSIPNVMAQDSYSFTIESESGGSTNNTPIANAGSDQLVPPLTTVTLDGSASYDPEDNTITYSWNQTAGPSVTLSNPTAVRPTFTPIDEGIYVFTLFVNNGTLTSNADTVMINVDTSQDDGGNDDGSGGGGDTNTEVTDIFNYTSSSGKFNMGISAKSSDESVEIEIPKDTIGTNQMGLRLTNINIERLTTNIPPPPNNGIILGNVYNINPDGAIFNPRVILNMIFSNSQVPNRVAEKNLVIGTYNWSTKTWQQIPSWSDPNNNTVTANLQHFSTYAILAYTDPANFEVTGISTSTDSITCGIDFGIQATVANTGDLSGDYEACLTLDDVILATERLTLDGGDSTTVSFNITTETAGVHTIKIGGKDITFTAESKVPATFSTSNINVSPTEIYLGESVEISTMISNSGDLSGIYEAILKIDNKYVESKSVGIAGGDSEIIIFTIVPDTEGEHSINIGDKVIFLEVMSAADADIEIVARPQPEISRFDITPTYDSKTGKIESTRIDYQIINHEELDPGSVLILKVFRDGEIWDELPLVTLSQMESSDKSGNLSYVPAAGWDIGTYIFEAELQEASGAIHSIQFEKFTLIEESITKAVSWGSLGVIIGGTLVVLLTVLGIVIYRRREMLRGYVE